VKYLLDSNAWINSIRRGSSSNVSIRLSMTPRKDVFLCSVVLGELLFGAYHGDPLKRSKNLLAIANLRQDHTSLPYGDAEAEECARIREDLVRKGTPIGSNDMMIAAIAMANGLKLVTHNTAEFSRVPGLQLEDWQ
jgi:tRNA(fMet)-specific endonuclease VapC